MGVVHIFVIFFLTQDSYQIITAQLKEQSPVLCGWGKQIFGTLQQHPALVDTCPPEMLIH